MAWTAESRAKVRRAEEHLKTFEADLWSYSDPIPLDVDLNLDASGKSGEVVVKILTQPKRLPVEDWGPVIGDIIHNFRSALDYLVNALIRSTGDTWQGGQFPIMDDPSDETRPLNRDTVSHLAPNHWAVIEGYQPHNRSNSNLRWLRDLSNQDKHRLLIAAFSLANLGNALDLITSTYDCTVDLAHWISGGSLETRAELTKHRVFVTGANPEVRVDRPYTPEIGIAGIEYNAVSVLQGIRAEVTEILDACEPLFPT